MRIMDNDNPFVGWAIWFGTRTAALLCTLGVAAWIRSIRVRNASATSWAPPRCTAAFSI